MSELEPTRTYSNPTATDELRRLLDERGVEWTKPKSALEYDETDWERGEWSFCAIEGADGELDLTAAYADWCSPAQAIDATLGRGTCRFEQIPEALYDDIECSECGVALWGFQMDIAGEGCPAKPRYCPNCGRKVVE